MHALKRLAVIGGDAEARPAFRALQIVLNGVAKPLHLFRPRQILLVNQHWRGKLSRRKQCCDVLEMRANGITAHGVLRVVGFGFNGAAIRVKPEMVCGLVVRESHPLIPALDNALMVLILLWSFVLLVHRAGSFFKRFVLWLLLRNSSEKREYKCDGDDWCIHDRENPFFRLFELDLRASGNSTSDSRRHALWRAGVLARRPSHSRRIPLSSLRNAFNSARDRSTQRSFSPARARTLRQGIPPPSRTAKMRDSSASEKPSETERRTARTRATACGAYSRYPFEARTGGGRIPMRS